MAGRKDRSSGFLPGMMAVLFWSIHFPLLLNYVSDTTPLTVFYFHALLWASIASMALLTLTGRIDELSLINRRSGTLFLLVLSGGYGLWMLMVAAFHFQNAGGRAIELFFYSGPLFLVFLSMFTRGGVRKGGFVMALAGFLGVFLILFSTGGMSVPAPAALICVAAAALCWAVFSIAASTLLRRSETLPILVLTLCLSTACLFLTSLMMRQDMLGIERSDIWVSMVVGALAIAGCYGLWMRCMTAQSTASNAATWWYGAVVFGAVWYHSVIDSATGWAGVVTGALFILFSFRASGRARERTLAVLGDLVTKQR